MRQVRIGVIGCGMISSIYLKNCTQTFDILDVVAVAAQHGMPLGAHSEGGAVQRLLKIVDGHGVAAEHRANVVVGDEPCHALPRTRVNHRRPEHPDAAPVTLLIPGD